MVSAHIDAATRTSGRERSVTYVSRVKNNVAVKKIERHNASFSVHVGVYYVTPTSVNSSVSSFFFISVTSSARRLIERDYEKSINLRWSTLVNPVSPDFLVRYTARASCILSPGTTHLRIMFQNSPCCVSLKFICCIKPPMNHHW